jgi:hypothetical protein
MTTDQERKAEVVKFSDGLRAGAVAKVTVSYYGNGDEGRAEPPQFQDAAGNPVEESRLPADLNLQTLGDLLESFAPEGYEDGEGGFGTSVEGSTDRSRGPSRALCRDGWLAHVVSRSTCFLH